MRRGLLSGLVIAALGALTTVPPQEVGSFEPLLSSAAGKLCGNGPLSRPRPGCSPPPPPSTGNPYDDCVARINQLRWQCQCLPPLKRWRSGESCANRLAKHDSKHGIHAGFNHDVCERKGRAQNECPAWPSTGEVIDGCLQRMWNEGPGKRFSKHGHYINMSSRSYEAVACGFARAAGGDVWSVQNFR